MAPQPYRCPKCGGAHFRRWELPHPLLVHWILNPGAAFNEVILGQRMVKTSLICRDCEGPLLDRTYIPCPSCRAMHRGRFASWKRAFGNWRGFACPTCGKPIPCLWNVFSLAILGVTFPLWALPYFLYFRKLPVRPLYQSKDGKPPTPKPLTRKTWIRMGAMYGALMWLSSVFLLPALTSDGANLGWRFFALVGLPLWTAGGFAFGFSMWFFLGRTPKRTNDGEQ